MSLVPPPHCPGQGLCLVPAGRGASAPGAPRSHHGKEKALVPEGLGDEKSPPG
jgi:hypothetical protein